MGTELMNIESDNQLSVAGVKSQVALIQGLMKEVLHIGEHFGTVPGCGDKKVLLKSGAEKISMLFRLRPEFDIQITDLGNGHREYQIKCDLYNISTGSLCGQGLGSACTMESKYRYRRAEGINTGEVVPKDYWKHRDISLIGGKGFFTKKVDGQFMIFSGGGDKTENPDIADTYNTVLKIAKKRAQVDAVLTATAASDIFTQDIEESLPEEDQVVVPDIQPPKTISHSKLKFIESTLSGSNSVVIEWFLKQKNIDPSRLVDATEEAAGEVIAMFNLWATNNPPKKKVDGDNGLDFIRRNAESLTKDIDRK